MNRKKLLFVTAPALLLLTMANTGCTDNSDDIQHKQQEQIAMQATQSVGMPAIVNFQEKRTYKEILELRDTALSTTTYIVDLNGGLHKLCDSIGFGIPYATQYTNPSRLAYAHENSAVLPQANPSGLFSPAGAEGTWILCLNPQTQKASPLYVEPRVIVSPFPLASK